MTIKLAIVFLAIAIIFVTVTLRDYLKSEDKLTIARKIWLRMAIIFTAMAIGLYLLDTVMN